MADRLSGTKSKLLLCATLAPFVLALIAHAAGPVPREISELPPKSSLAFSQYLVDKGRVDPTSLEDARFRFFNTGTEPLEITRIKASCGCLQPIISLNDKQHRPEADGSISLKVEPGAAGEIMMRVQTANQKPGAKEYTVSVYSRDSQPRKAELLFRLDLPERGVIVRPGQMVLYQLNGVPTDHTIVVTDMRDETLSIEGMRCTSDLVQLTVEAPRFNEHGFREFPIQMTIAGKVPPGKHVAVVRIFTNDSSYPELRVPLWIYGPERPAAQIAIPDAVQQR